jgi:hypothetical protein
MGLVEAWEKPMQKKAFRALALCFEALLDLDSPEYKRPGKGGASLRELGAERPVKLAC